MTVAFVVFIIIILNGFTLILCGKYYDNENIKVLGSILLIAIILLLSITCLIVYAPEVLSTSFFIGCGLHCFLFVR